MVCRGLVRCTSIPARCYCDATGGTCCQVAMVHGGRDHQCVVMLVLLLWDKFSGDVHGETMTDACLIFMAFPSKPHRFFAFLGTMMVVVYIPTKSYIEFYQDC